MLSTKMKMMTVEIAKPCVYHYLFSRLPIYTAKEDVNGIAGKMSSPIIKQLQLDSDETFESPHPDVIPLTYRSNEASKTYLLQFWFNDILTTILTQNNTDRRQDPVRYLQKSLKPDSIFGSAEAAFGTMSVVFVQAKQDVPIVEFIARHCFDADVSNNLPVCHLEWGTLYFLPMANRYVLLVDEAAKLFHGDTFLAFDFPMLEAIRQKLIYEQSEASKLKIENLRMEVEIKKLLDCITENLDGRYENISKVEAFLHELDDSQAEIYSNISRTETVLHTLSINIRNIDSYIKAIPVKSDSLFAPLLKDFRFIYENIEAGLKYTKLLLPSIVKRQETIPLKIDLLRQRAQEQNNKIEKRQNMLIAVFGVILGAGEVFPPEESEYRLLWMGLSGIAAFILMQLFNLKMFKRENR